MEIEAPFVQGFGWAVPSAFRDALASCRFEEGDTLYDTQDAYGRIWAESKNLIKHSIQVAFPPRGPRSTNDDDDAVFLSNWLSSVHVNLYKYPEASVVKRYVTTQGRLYSMLWHGDLAVLDVEGPEVSAPLGAAQLLYELAAVKPIALELSREAPVFVMPYDQAARLPRSKFSAVVRAISKVAEVQPVLLSCSEASIPSPERFSPTVGVAIIPGNGMSPLALESAIKEVLYKPSKNTRVPRFNLGRHGVLYE